MNQKALGMIETYGLVAAIEAADVALKTAAVELINYEIVKSGRIMIAIYGEVAAVQASVTAGAAAAAKINTVFSAHVIPRPLADPRLLIKHRDTEEGPLNPGDGSPDSGGNGPGPVSPEEYTEKEGINEGINNEALEEERPGNIQSRAPENLGNSGMTVSDEQAQLPPGLEHLKSMSVEELRRLARRTEGIAIKGRQISRANKEKLIAEIVRAKKN